MINILWRASENDWRASWGWQQERVDLRTECVNFLWYTEHIHFHVCKIVLNKLNARLKLCIYIILPIFEQTFREKKVKKVSHERISSHIANKFA